ncbi:MAG: hypothetical protein K5697_02125 [Lachnospiraceae bacterium]|nr:hypothetical protein [Lachnospiraceae bacterium]
MRRRTLENRFKRSFSALLIASLLCSETLPVLAEGGDPLPAEDTVSAAEADRGGADSLSADSVSVDAAATEESGENDPGSSPEESENGSSIEDSNEGEEYGFLPGYLESETERNACVIDTGYDYYEMRDRLQEDTEVSADMRMAAEQENDQPAPAFPCGYDEDWLSYFRENYPDTRNQNPYGTCWAHSSVGLIEFNLIRQGLAKRSVDLSEAHLFYWCYVNGTPSIAGDTGDRVTLTNEGFGEGLRGGGNLECSVNTLMRQRGVASENTASYASVLEEGDGWTGADPSTEREDVAWLTNGYFIGIRENPEQVKEAILRNGAVGISYRDYSSFYNAEHNSYYGDRFTDTNHAVMVVGWDDEFPRDFFEKQPENNGAWLIRNSWSTEIRAGRNSYFWLSYEDTSIKGAWVFEAAAEFPYDNHYYYDSQIHWPGSRKYSDTSLPGYSANVYTVCGESGADREKLEAVTFQAPSSWAGGTDYSILIYRNLTDPSNPASGHLETESITKGTVYYTGEYTVRLKRPVVLDRGENFSVVIKTENGKSVAYEVPLYNWPFVSSEVNAQTGQSFWSSTTESWKDLAELHGSYTYQDVKYEITPNFVISALTTDVPEPQDGKTYHRIRFEWREGANEKKMVHGEAPDPMRVPMPAAVDFVCWADKDTGEVWDPSAPVLKDRVLTACYADDISEKISAADPVPVLNENSLYLIVGQTFRLDASAEWSLYSDIVLKLDKKKQQLKAVKEGVEILKYTKDGETKQILVYVTAPAFEKKKLSLIPGQEEKLSLKMVFYGSDRTEYYPILWESSDPSVATVTDGIVCAGAKGSCEISAIVNGKRLRCKVKVNDTETPLLDGVDDEIALMPLQTVRLKRKGFSYKNMSWASEAGMKLSGSGKKQVYEDAVVRITADGKLSAIGTGTTVLHGSRTEKNGSVTQTSLTVHVEELPEQRVFVNLNVPKPLRFYGVKNKDATDWTSDSPSFVSVDEKGRVCGLAVGSAVVSCRYRGFVYRARVFVENYALQENAALQRKKENNPYAYVATLSAGQTLRLEAVKGEGYGSYQPAYFASSKPELAYVDQYGVLHALAPGRVTISCRRNGKNLKISLKVG